MHIDAPAEAATSQAAELCPEVYAYLLGVYLGDGTVVANGSSYRLQVALDLRYPGIIEEVADAAAALAGRPTRIHRVRDKQLVVLHSNWKHWPSLIPQHAPGRKHTRPIVLTRWQQELVALATGRILRGLIHTDGWRGVNRVRAKGAEYAYPRYQFSNRSDDIRRIFTDACDRLGIEWRAWSRYHISVAKRDAVARLDAHVGEKH